MSLGYKKVEIMKKVKILVASVLFCAMGYTGYTAHERMTISEAEKFMKANIEALTDGEIVISGQKCSLRKGEQWCAKRKAYRKCFAYLDSNELYTFVGYEKKTRIIFFRNGCFTLFQYKKFNDVLGCCSRNVLFLFDKVS